MPARYRRETQLTHGPVLSYQHQLDLGRGSWPRDGWDLADRHANVVWRLQRWSEHYPDRPRARASDLPSRAASVLLLPSIGRREYASTSIRWLQYLQHRPLL